MITKEMIKKGFENGIISIENDYAGCMGICCKIGDNAFYFLGSKDDSITKEEYWKSYTLDMTIDMVFDILKSAKMAEENGLDDWEIGYYESVLSLSEQSVCPSLLWFLFLSVHIMDYPGCRFLVHQ